jgi:hypothetical protein
VLSRRLLVLAAVLAVGTGCPGIERRFVADALAARHYHAAQYRHVCVTPEIPDPAVPDVVTGPADVCSTARGLTLNEALFQTNLANDTQKIGKLPPIAKQRLKVLKKQMEKDDK